MGIRITVLQLTVHTLKMFRLARLATLSIFLLFLVALSFANPLISIEHRSADQSCEGRIELMTSSGEIESASKNFKIKPNARRSSVQIQGVKVYGNCCWRLEERNNRWVKMFSANQETNDLNRYIYKGIKQLC